MSEETVRTPEGEITYTLTFKKVRRLNLRVHPDGRVAVSAPLRTSKKTVTAFVLSHTDFIFRALAKFRAKVPPPPPAVGEKIWYRGKQYILRTEKGRTCARTEGDTLTLSLPDPAVPDLAAPLARAVAALYTPFLLEKCAAWGKEYEKYGVRPPKEIRFRKMKTMWGNCRPSERILTFSTMLTEVPDECLDYVICHEFTHFLHPDHSPAFYRALARVYPDWERVRRELKQRKYRLDRQGEEI